MLFNGFVLTDESGQVLAKCESGADLLKAHVKGYTRKDGVFVAEHDDKRQAAQPKPLSGRINSDVAFDKIKAAGGANIASTSDHIAYDHHGVKKQIAHADDADGHRYVDSAELERHLSALGSASGQGKHQGNPVDKPENPVVSANPDDDVIVVKPGAMDKDAKQLPFHAFLNKYVAEVLPEHMDAGVRPGSMVHDSLPTSELDPSEWDDWSAWKDFDAQGVMPGASDHIKRLAEKAKGGGRLNSVLVTGHKDDREYRPQVVDGHHRTAAMIEAGKKQLGVIYDTKTLAERWLVMNGKPKSGADDLVKRYREFLKGFLAQGYRPNHFRSNR